MDDKEQCILCGSASFEVLLTGRDRCFPGSNEEFRVARCRECGLVCTLPYVDEKALKGYYPKEYYCPREPGRKDNIDRLRSWFSGYYSRSLWRSLTGKDPAILSRLGSFLLETACLPFYKWRNACFPYAEVPGRFLDVGCGDGKLLADEKELGWDVCGVELSEKMAVYARDVRGLNVIPGPFDKGGFERASFDIVNLHHVLEHFLDPISALKDICDILRPGGLVVIRTPNLSRAERMVFRRFWWGYELPRHRFHFDRTSIGMLLKRSGFSVLKVVYPLETNTALLSMRNILVDMGAPRCAIDFFSVNNKVLRAFLMPFAMLMKVTGNSGEILVYARKEKV